MHWKSWTVSSIPAEPEEAWSVTSRTPGSHAAWDRCSLTVEPTRGGTSDNRAPAVRLELIFAESAFIKTYLLQMFLRELELLTRTIDLTIQDRALSLKAVQHVPLKASI